MVLWRFPSTSACAKDVGLFYCGDRNAVNSCPAWFRVILWQYRGNAQDVVVTRDLPYRSLVSPRIPCPFIAALRPCHNLPMHVEDARAASPLVLATGLRKSYGDLVAVQEVSLSVRPGEIVGIVGPNGSGKTTTIRMLLDIIQPDDGEVAIFGAPITTASRERIGYLPEERGLYRGLRVIPNLLYLAELKGVARDQALRRSDRLLEQLGLEPHRSKKVQELSRGLGQLVQFASTLVHNPEFVVLDEPFSGLDPVNVRVMKDAVAELRAAGVAIMFSTHQMSDVEELCDRILMIDHGRVVLDGPVAEIKRRFAGNEVFVASNRAPEGIDGVLEWRRDGVGYVLTLADGYAPEHVLRTLLERGATIDRFELATPSLEQIFLQVVGSRNA